MLSVLLAIYAIMTISLQTTWVLVVSLCFFRNLLQLGFLITRSFFNCLRPSLFLLLLLKVFDQAMLIVSEIHLAIQSLVVDYSSQKLFFSLPSFILVLLGSFNWLGCRGGRMDWVINWVEPLLFLIVMIFVILL